MTERKIEIVLALIAVNICFRDVSSQVTVGQPCYSPDQYPGKCTEWENCDSVMNLRFKSPQTHLDRTYVTLSQCGMGGNRPMVCCTQSPYPQNSLANSQPKVQTSSKRPLPRTTTQTPNFVNEKQEQTFECGGIIDNRIYGGSETRIDELPFTAILAYSKTAAQTSRRKVGFYCGGALISENSVVTAAHCVDDSILADKQWRLNGVRLGEWNQLTSPDCDYAINSKPLCAPPAIDARIARKIIHENFVPFDSNLGNDIAILKLERSVKFTEFIRPVCLPLSRSVEDFNQLPLIVAGFGRTETSDFSNIKLKTEIRGITNDACRSIYSSDNQAIYATQMCALGESGKDSCNGDSGQPLIFVNTKSYPPRLELVGIVSYGPSPCGQTNKPGVYTRISPFLSWIQTNMK